MDPPDDRQVFDVTLKPASSTSTFDDSIGVTAEYLDTDGTIVDDEEKINNSNHLRFSIRSELTNELLKGGEATLTIPSGIRYISLKLIEETPQQS